MLQGMHQRGLSSNTPEDRVCLGSVLRCLEGEFYSYAKQTASGLLFNTRVRAHETEREYAVALQQCRTSDDREPCGGRADPQIL